ncbi:MAG: XdhC family aldehyde oxidoreductase maturation factor [Syntrophobacteraceae bacterium]
MFRTMFELLRQGESFAVATIFDKSGSAPRTEGAKMVVRADGSIIGTIGGGRLEANAIALAKETIRARRTVVQSFDLTSREAAASDMICGGSGEILLDFIDANDENNLMIYEEAAEIIVNGKSGWLITVLGKSDESTGIQCRRCLVKPDKTMIGSITCSSYLLEKLLAGPAKITIHSEAFDEHRFLVEPLRQGGTVYIFGAGHVSQKIAPLSESVGFRTIVMDDRQDYANRERFPEPIVIKVIDSFKELPALDIDEQSYLVIVTRGHLFDKDVLRQVLRRKAAYIGMIGSRSKRDLIYEEMLGKGFTKEELGAVYSPIGTDIGAETPEELAVSIVGELVKVRSEKNGCKKKTKGSDSTPCCRIQMAPQ